jgi:hypothetical protein
MLEGRLDFSDSFRAACSASTLCDLRYISGSCVHFMSCCDAGAQEAARAWLRTALGVVHDAGHVHALCALTQSPPKPHAYLLTLINTRAYMPRTA